MASSDEEVPQQQVEVEAAPLQLEKPEQQVQEYVFRPQMSIADMSNMQQTG